MSVLRFDRLTSDVNSGQNGSLAMVRHGFEDLHGPGDAFQLELAHLDHLETVRRGDADEILADEDLPGPGLRRDPSGDVDGSAEVIALVIDHRSGVHSDVGRWETARPDALDDLE